MHIYKSGVSNDLSGKELSLSSFFIVKREPFILTLPQQNVTSRYFMYINTQELCIIDIVERNRTVSKMEVVCKDRSHTLK